ncbi:MAG TPA: hypothetical protein VMV47_08825 [Bacteroidales bacterium]|nr:hypothetical protein [Bacteroidales bacterium]
MKQKMYILGVVTVLIIFAGTIFKVNHWPLAGFMIVIGLLTLVLVFLPIALTDHYKAVGNRQNLLLHIVTWLTCFVVFTGILFKIMHWPFANTILTIALIFPYVVFLPVFLVTTSKDKNFNIYNTVFVLLLLATNSVLSAMLSLNVSAERINDSYNLSRQYNQVGRILDLLPANDSKSQVVLKIDEALKVVDEYKNLILRSEDMTPEQYNDAGSLLRPDLRGAAIQKLSTTGNVKVGEKLDNTLKALVKEIEKCPECEELTKAIPAILDLRQQYEDEPLLIWHNITNTLSWTFIYLEGLETNLKMIKTTLL